MAIKLSVCASCGKKGVSSVKSKCVSQMFKGQTKTIKTCKYCGAKSYKYG